MERMDFRQVRSPGGLCTITRLVAEYFALRACPCRMTGQKSAKVELREQTQSWGGGRWLVVKSRLARGGHILQDMPPLLAQGCHNGQQALDKVTAGTTLGPKAAFTPEHDRTQGPLR